MNSKSKMPLPEVQKKMFGTLSSGVEVFSYTLINSNGSQVSILTYGAIIQSIKVSDSEGNFENVVLSYEDLDSYLKDDCYIGATIGRYANRIQNAAFTLDGKLYTLDANNGSNNLHGGSKGFDKAAWTAESSLSTTSASVSLSYLSPAMESGFPGTLNTKVVFTLTNENALKISYAATTDKKTVVNMTNHSYFNLSGHFKSSVLDHYLQIDSDNILEIDPNLIPTSKQLPVKSTPFDFRKSKQIGLHIKNENEQLHLGSGYDHCWVLNNNEKVKLVSTVAHEASGRILEVFTNEPGMQLYTGNSLNGFFQKHSGFCLETQHFPNSPNQVEFPTVELNPDELYTSTTIFKFSTN